MVPSVTKNESIRLLVFLIQLDALINTLIVGLKLVKNKVGLAQLTNKRAETIL